MGIERQAILPTERSIPHDIPSVAGWKDIPIREPVNPEPLVPLGAFSGNDGIYTSSVYSGEHANSPYPDSELEGSMLTVFVREGVARQLKAAQACLPYGMHLIVFDAYRSLDVQQSLYNQYQNALKQEHPGWDVEQLSTETQRYVSLPASPTFNSETTFVSPHNTGGAVDLAIFKLPDEAEAELKKIENEVEKLDATGEEDAWKQIYELQMKRLGLINKNAQMLDFGTQFDYGGKEASLTYLEELVKERPLTTEEKNAQTNRRLLYNTMIDAGFQPYEDEWWHYNSTKSQMGARTAGLDHAEYGSASLSDKNKSHEVMRKNHRIGTLRLHEGIGYQSLSTTTELFKAAKNGANETGDLRIVSLPEVAKIAPPKTT